MKTYMTKTEYFNLLRDPRWQKKRLEIMERDGFKCLSCGIETETLNVHHGYYEGRKNPWEYPDASLHTLCEPCHKYETDYGNDAKKRFAAAFARIGYKSDDYEHLAAQLDSSVHSVLMGVNENAHYAIALMLRDPEFMEKVKALSMTHEQRGINIMDDYNGQS